MQQPITSKKSLFVDRWSSAEFINAKLMVILFVMGFMLLSLVSAVIFLVIRPRAIYYVPGAISAGVAYAQTDRKMTASLFAVSWVLNWSNFTPANVENVYTYAQQFMSPRLLAQTRLRLKKDVDQIKKNNMSSLFSVSQDPQVKEEGRNFEIIIKGDKGVYMGKEEVKLQRMTYRLRLRQSPTTNWNPYGLIIEDISQEVEK